MAGWWQGLLGHGWGGGGGAEPESVHVGFQGVEGVHEEGSGITVGRKDKHSHRQLCSLGRTILGQRTALQVGWGGQLGQGEAGLQARPCVTQGLWLCAQWGLA